MADLITAPMREHFVMTDIFRSVADDWELVSHYYGSRMSYVEVKHYTTEYGGRRCPLIIRMSWDNLDEAMRADVFWNDQASYMDRPWVLGKMLSILPLILPLLTQNGVPA